MKKNYFFTIALILIFGFSALSFIGCGMGASAAYMKRSIVGVSNVESEQEVESEIKAKRKNRKMDKVTVEQNVIYGPSIGYGSIKKEERLKYSDKTDKNYGIFRYRFYYDYSTPDVILVFLDVDTYFRFVSAADQAGVTFKLDKGWPENHLYSDIGMYRELYIINLPLKYVETNKNKAIVIDLISNSEGYAVSLGSAFYSDKENLSRTFHIPQFYIKGFLRAIDKHKPEQK